eukprot:TRINITY_DN842_c1_g2_i4.p1 TRINITY_DN842_c1_g2~~TRINITY_DN842_c1_g2_i4.p1  ORF type:complete len:188 (+),score=33.19 TRINITY_DN842_c1_g2_i4:44-565(+)
MTESERQQNGDGSEMIPEDGGQLLELVTSMISDKVDQYQLTGGRTALYVAAKMGYTDIVKMICEQLENPAELINLQMPHSLSTALHASCHNGRHECVAYLVSLGADCNIENHYHETPLLNALQEGGHQTIGRVLPKVSIENFTTTTRPMDFTNHFFGGNPLRTYWPEVDMLTS